MVLLQLLRRQVATSSTGRIAAHPVHPARVAHQSWRPQQRAQFHRVFAQKTASSPNTATWRQLLSRFRNTNSRRWNSSRPTPDPTPHLGSPTPQLSFFQRFKQLGKEYGWVVTGVYFGLSALDLPFCFLAVRGLGTDRVARWEHAIVGTIKDAVKAVMPEVGNKADEVVEQVETAVGSPAAREGNVWGVPEAEARNNEEASKALWTQFVLAYAIHKSFIFIRVPLAVAITPKVVKTLRSWGWQIGKKKLRSAKPTKP
ncbi:hypothetical protein D6D10_00621 [Aureobasidium pullulans]|uniref:DUF1279 domain-containing protein n=1 Tax=Aureobasidium pullulans TaxID=5580 RepID=A0A4S9F8N1_AURPU|nr:hypothetical protein D6D10_00621 [Aureobasidium pullulans]